ncbi:hypothetical protein CapIbe_012712 [Capra ibex]
MNILTGTSWNAFFASGEMFRFKGRPVEKIARNSSNSNGIRGSHNHMLMENIVSTCTLGIRVRAASHQQEQFLLCSGGLSAAHPREATTWRDERMPQHPNLGFKSLPANYSLWACCLNSSFPH